MASKTSTELSATEIELKRRGRRRLIGAITIGLLGIVFLPMIFDGEPKRSLSGSTLKKQEISIQVPAKDGLPPLPAPSAAPAQSTPVPAPQSPATAVVEPPAKETPQAVKAATETGVPTPAPQAVQAKPEKPESIAKPKATVADKKGFSVQLGVYGDADNAKLAITKMKDAKLPVYTDSIPIKSGTATRVRVGPFPTHEKAESALAQIKLAGGDGKIVPLP